MLIFDTYQLQLGDNPHRIDPLTVTLSKQPSLFLV